MLDVEHCAEELYALGARIGRLALAAGVDLSQAETLAALIDGGRPAERGEAHVLTQLRALIALWYQVQTRCIERFGLETAANLIAVEEERLRRRGFEGFGARTARATEGTARRPTAAGPGLPTPVRAAA